MNSSLLSFRGKGGNFPSSFMICLTMTDILVSLTEKIRQWLQQICPAITTQYFSRLSSAPAILELWLIYIKTQLCNISPLFFISDSFAMPDAWLCGLRSNLNKTQSIILRGRMQFLPYFFFSLSLSLSLSLALSRYWQVMRDLDLIQHPSESCFYLWKLSSDKVLFQGYLKLM